MTDELLPILFVDDDANLLAGFRRNLRKQFEVRTELGGEAGLRAISETPQAFAVVVSDLRMPEMDGIDFLTRVRAIAPDSTRILLTGNADVSAAMAAVNEGNIFRFLTKPCPSLVLVSAIEAACEHHRLVTAERVLLERTLHGSVNMLTEVLAITSPSAFGRVSRLKKLAGDVAEAMGGVDRWKVELAAMVSQVAHVSLPNEVVASLRSGDELTDKEQKMVDRLPEVAVRLIEQIPRLEEVQLILRHQGRAFADGATGTGASEGEIEIPLGSRILKAVIDLGAIDSRELVPSAEIEVLRRRTGRYDPAVLAVLETVLNSSANLGGEIQLVSVSELISGMVLLEAVLDGTGRLLVAAGQETSVGLCERLRNFASNVGVKEPIRVVVRAVESS